jgi:hypothetical protein
MCSFQTHPHPSRKKPFLPKPISKTQSISKKKENKKTPIHLPNQTSQPNAPHTASPTKYYRKMEGVSNFDISVAKQSKAKQMQTIKLSLLE